MTLINHFENWQRRGVRLPQPVAVGRVTRTVGLTLEARGIDLPLGGRCRVWSRGAGFNPLSDSAVQGQAGEVEVVGFDAGKTYLMPLRPIEGIRPGAIVEPLEHFDAIPAGEGLLGRVLGGTGEPIDGLGPLDNVESISFHPSLINPLDRQPIDTPLDVGVRSINGMLTIGAGQRIGLFAGSGVGKSVLLGMMTRFTGADLIVVALVGERGREVREFVENNIGSEGMARAVVVASPADETPVMRLRAGMLASRLAEYYRDRGQKVLLLFDSLTRYAQAQREVALATGEPPATRGYPPSVFASLPKLVERAGTGNVGQGSVTAFYTVLTEGDDMMDPVADASRAILDGHIVLSRDIADEGIYPAVDIQSSISRSMPMVVSDEHMELASHVKQLSARYQQSRDLINVGAYSRGVDLLTDQAIDSQPAIRQFLSQGLNTSVSFQSSVTALAEILRDSLASAGEGIQTDGGVVVDQQPQGDPLSQNQQPGNTSTQEQLSQRQLPAGGMNG